MRSRRWTVRCIEQLERSTARVAMALGVGAMCQAAEPWWAMRDRTPDPLGVNEMLYR